MNGSFSTRFHSGRARPRTPTAQRPTSLFPRFDGCLLAGEHAEAQKLVLENFTCRGPGSGNGSGAKVQYGCYQVFGNLRLAFGASRLWTCLRSEVVPARAGPDRSDRAGVIRGERREVRTRALRQRR